MKKIFKTFSRAILAGLLAGAFILPAVPAHAQLFQGSVDEACKGAGVSDLGTCQDGQAESQVNNAVKQGINIFSFAIGAIAVVMIMVAGVKYVTSSGDPNSVNSAKNTLLYALVGLVVAGLAQVLVRFVVDKF